ncbi:hypothetical protein MAR_001549 [Mya arenaria]|uniref:Uncharacterized protein n=1 Tax=Mya arenaria TaxID=6604 RepID=A0ABY7FFJ4_MYAAR|nr:hypothetical protein MAR_001549 [Mya arenaria]
MFFEANIFKEVQMQGRYFVAIGMKCAFVRNVLSKIGPKHIISERCHTVVFNHTIITSNKTSEAVIIRGRQEMENVFTEGRNAN